jgi:prevent-host-death family protein
MYNLYIPYIFDCMQYYSITEARTKLGELVNRVRYTRKAIALGKHGKVDVFLVAVGDEDESIPISEINAASDSFAFLKDEPDLYSIADLKKRYV